MVTPSNKYSWDQFETPETYQNKIQVQEKQKKIPPDFNEGKKEYSWGQFQTPSTYQGEIDPTADEGTFDWLLRNASAHAVRGLETAIGKYGDIQKAAENFIAEHPGSLGIFGKALHSLIGDEKWKSAVTGSNNLLKIDLPTTQEIRSNLTEPATGEYLKPKNEKEKFTQEIASDIGSIGGAKVGGNLRNRLTNYIAIPTAANLVKSGTKELGLEEKYGDYGKLATWTALSLANNVNAPAYAAQLMNQGRNGFGPNVRANVPRYHQNLDRVARNMLHGDPRSALAQQQILGIRNDIANGQLSMNNLMNRIDAINAAKRDRGLFQLNRADRNAARRNINQVRDVVRDEIVHLGQSNPQALRAWQEGMGAFAAIHRSRAITDMARRFADRLHGAGEIGSIFGLGTGIVKAPLGVATGATVVPAAYKTGQVLFRVMTNPTLAHYYWDAIGAAGRGDSNVFIKNYNRLNDEYKKKYDKSPKKKPHLK